MNRIDGFTMVSGAGRGSGNSRRGVLSKNELHIHTKEGAREREMMIFEHIKMRSSDYFATEDYSSIHSIKLYKRSIYLMVSNSDSEDTQTMCEWFCGLTQVVFFVVALLGINSQCQASIPTINKIKPKMMI